MYDSGIMYVACRIAVGLACILYALIKTMFARPSQTLRDLKYSHGERVS